MQTNTAETQQTRPQLDTPGKPDGLIGRVFLIGAGPGDPGLMTVTGMHLLRTAQAVVFDALANPRLLAEAPVDAERVDVGKRARDHKMSQDDINALLVTLAKRGLRVVRLKGGDPYLYGRGAEEASYCASHGVPVEVVPGVTSGIAAPAYAGIPVTHRKLASTVTFITGHEDPRKAETSIDYAALAPLIARGGTACFYMGVARLGAIAEQLSANGLSIETPAAVVQWGTLATQRTARGTLATIERAVADAGVSSPAIIVVGAVAAIVEPGLNFFTDRPLFGKTVVVMRTRQQASRLSAELEALGACVIETPTIELVPPASFEAVDTAIASLFQGRTLGRWLVLTSVNAIDVLADRMGAMGVDARSLSGVRLAAGGEASADRLRDRLRLRADLVPGDSNGEALAQALLSACVGDVAPARFVLLRADIGRPALPTLLKSAGHEVVEAVAYHTRSVDALPAELLAALEERRVDWLAFTSSSTAKNLVALLGESGLAMLAGVRVASIGPVTSETLRELGLVVSVESPEANVSALANAIAAAAAER